MLEQLRKHPGGFSLALELLEVRPEDLNEEWDFEELRLLDRLTRDSEDIDLRKAIQRLIKSLGSKQNKR